MHMNIDDQPSLLSLELEGSFDELSADWLRVLRERVSRAPTDVLMNLARVSYIDSKGLGALFDLNERVEELGFHIYFCECSDPVEEVFELAGLQHILRVYESEPAARKAIRLDQESRKGGGAAP
jgi:anti-sigma B factor antagonist